MLDKQDRLILAHLQDDFPLDPRPYAALAKRLKIPLPRIKARIGTFCKKGVIRYIGAVIDTKKAGFSSSLVAMAVPPRQIAKVSGIINGYPEVTHNYLREGEYNIWFTVSCATGSCRRALIRRIALDTGITKWLDLATLKVFKINARFPLAGGKRRGPSRKANTARTHGAVPLNNRTLAALVQALDTSDRPFLDIARRLGCSEHDAVGCIKAAMDRKLIRRFGAVLDHYKIGLRANALVAWQVDAKDMRRAAKVMASMPYVSHCYLRKTLPGWPYSLYTMVHATDRAACRKILQLILLPLGPTIKGMKVLFTKRELKKTRFDLKRLELAGYGRKKKI